MCCKAKINTIFLNDKKKRDLVPIQITVIKDNDGEITIYDSVINPLRNVMNLENMPGFFSTTSFTFAPNYLEAKEYVNKFIQDCDSCEYDSEQTKKYLNNSKRKASNNKC